MSVGKTAERLWRELHLAPLLFWRYGSLFPDRVSLPEAAACLHVDPHDRRARKKLMLDAVRGRYPLHRRFWNEFLAAMQPQLALDIGANYGECVFSARYHEGCTALAFEANPALLPYLLRSRDDHPDAKRIDIVPALVGAVHGGHADFYLDDRWSGASTAVVSIAQANGGRRIEVQRITVDDCLAARQLAPDSLLFKLDIEGYEPEALRGMRQVLAQARSVVGLVELNTGSLAAAGWTVAEYQAQLLADFAIHIPIARNHPAMRRVDSLSDCMTALEREQPGKPVHLDLLLIKHGSVLGDLPGHWQLNG